jgi:[protein-PII] uridylyltransferase
MWRMTPGIQPDTIASVSPAAAAVSALEQRIAAQHASGAPGAQTCGLATDLCDEVVRGVWQGILAALPAEDAAAIARHASLVAHGGYGRREMAPDSDVDLMILHDGRAARLVAEVARRLLQELFDAGLQVGQSVRTVAEAVRLAAGDATIYSTLTACRLISGNAELQERLAVRLATLARRSSRRLVERLVEARREEAEKFGQTVALLEPNVKRSTGGLRDIQLVRWLGFTVWGSPSFDVLAHLGVVSRRDADSLRDASEFLLRLRNELHIAAGKANDDLTRDEQVRIAAARGIESQDGLLGVEQFMREYFRHTRQVARVLEGVVHRCRGRPRSRRIVSGIVGHKVDGLFRVGPGDVGALPGREAAVAASPALVVRLLELSMLYELPVEPETWEAVREAAESLPPEAADAETTAAFLALLGRAGRLGGPLRRLHEVGLLERIIPQFAHARHLLQFNNYHKFTVDEHCIVAVERAIDFAADEGWLGGVWRQINRKRTVILALLIHDLGKGFVEDHSELGARMARDVAARLGLPADEAAIIEYLVLKHLAMAHIAFRRDIGDGSIVVRFACDVGSPEVLRMLTVLTAADVGAVGPGTWTRWKSDLLGDLYFRTLAYLDGESPSVAAERHGRSLAALVEPLAADDPIARLARELPPSYLRDTRPEEIVDELRQLVRLPDRGIFTAARWHPETATVTVTVGTRESVAPGVFHRLTGALTSQRLEILAADIHTLSGGLVIDHFVVRDPDFSGEPPAERFAEIAAAIRDAIKADAPPTFSRLWNPFAPLPLAAARAPTRVLFDNESSAETTILEVFAHDSAGLLYCIAKVLFESGLSVRAAKIGTYLDQVVDAFHVTGAAGGKVVDETRLAAIRQAIERVAAPLGPGDQT